MKPPKIYTSHFNFNDIDFLSFLYPEPSTNEVEDNSAKIDEIKSILAEKIKNLPLTPYTHTALFEIDEFLAISNNGGKKRFIQNELRAIPNLSVKKASAILCKHILSLDCSLTNLKEMFKIWQADNLVNIDILLSPGKHHFKDFINGYSTNPAIKELTLELARVSGMGQGKGEFLLSVFSSQITKRQKGDLDIAGINIEVKTNDSGSARYNDQDVSPLQGYSGAVENFKSTWSHYVKQLKKLPKTGLSFDHIYTVSTFIPAVKHNQYFSDVEEIISNLFPTANVAEIVDMVRQDRIWSANCLYARANFNYYQSVKVNDDAVLYLDISTDDPISVCFKSCEELDEYGLELSPKTIYPIVYSGDRRLCYPQIKIE